MKITLSTDSPASAKVDLVAVGVYAKGAARDPAVKAIDRAMGGGLLSAIKEEDFRGEVGDVLKVPSRGKVGARWVVLVGLGKGTPKASDARVVAVRGAQAARQQRTLAVAIPSDGPDAVRAAAEGALMGAYKYSRYFTGSRKPRGGIRAAVVLVDDKKAPALLRALEEGVATAEGINLARDLVNAPPNDLDALALADAARKACQEVGVKCTVWDKKQIEKHGMHLLLAVNRGSKTEPRFVHMTYKPAGAKRRVVFVGKGLTFDSGGLCIKPPKSMVDMKCDMAGAATTIGIVWAAARLKLSVEVHGIIGATDNMSGGDAYRPGDVFPSLDGKTVEIINTDAEGRLVLADALAYARELKPDFLVDHATLTGACMVALGRWTAGLFANDDELGELYGAAARDAAESFWRLPLTEELKETLKSDIADLKHTGDGYGGSITAALFLQEFVGSSKWAHCDIAGPAFLEQAHAVGPKGGTGFGVATGVAFLRALARGRDA